MGCIVDAYASIIISPILPSPFSTEMVFMLHQCIIIYISEDVLVVLWEPSGIILMFTVDRSSGGGNYSAVATVAVPASPSYRGSQIL